MDERGDLDLISSRLKKIEEILGLSPLKMAKMGKISQATYYRYRRGVSVPDLKFLNNIINYDNSIRAEWLLRGRGPILNSDRGSGLLKDEPSKSDSVSFIHLPLYDMKTEHHDAEGKLHLNKWKNPKQTLPLCNKFIRDIIDTETDDLFALRIHCDSMAPEVKRGGLVLVDKGQTRMSMDGIFIVSFDKIIRMKLLQRLPNNRVHMSTINKKFDPIVIDLDDNDKFKNLGRIVWAGTPL